MVVSAFYIEVVGDAEYLWVSVFIYYCVTFSLYVKFRNDNVVSLKNIIPLFLISVVIIVLNFVFIGMTLLIISSIYSSFWFFYVFYFVFLFGNFLLSVSIDNKRSLLVTYSILVFLLLIFFSYQSNILLGKIGVGGFYSNYFVKYQSFKIYDDLSDNIAISDSSCNKVLKIKGNKKEYECKKKSGDIKKKYPKIVLLKNVFVVAALPDKLIISSGKCSTTMYSIPKSNFISEIITNNL